MLSNPDTQDILLTVHRDTQHYIGSLGHISVILLDLVVDSIHKDKWVDRFQRAIVPGCNFWHNFLTDLCDQLRRNVHVIQALDLLCNIPLAHPAGV